MGVLDQFCRFCTQELDHSERRNIFQAENSHLLETALRCIPLPMAASDRYPNFACYPCVSKLSDVAAFQSNGLAAVNFFDEFLKGYDENSSTSAEHCHEEIKNELFEETEMDFVEEFTPKLEKRSENEIEDLDLVQDKAELILQQEPLCHLKKCVVKLTRLENVLPGTECIPAKQGENVSFGVDEESSSESQCIAETASKQINSGGSSKCPFFCDEEIKNELFEETEMDFVEEFTPKLEKRSENEIEDVDLVQDKAELILQQEPLCHLKKCVVKLTRLENVLPGTECIPAKQGENVTLGVDEESSSESQCIAETDSKQINSGGSSKCPFFCDLCHKTFKRKWQLNRHLRVHSDERPFECGYCKKCFKQKSELKTHSRIHTGEKPFECGYCKKSFGLKVTLKNHVRRIHTGEKPFECGYCKKRLSRKVTLKNHVRSHTGEKPFECGYCKKCFNQKSNLLTHIRIHSGEKPFECGYCKKCFSQKPNLLTHIRIHSGEKPFECGDCKKCFNQKSELKSHSRIHTGEKPFKCEYCKKRFGHKGTLVGHVRFHTSR